MAALRELQASICDEPTVTSLLVFRCTFDTDSGVSALLSCRSDSKANWLKGSMPSKAVLSGSRAATEEVRLLVLSRPMDILSLSNWVISG